MTLSKIFLIGGVATTVTISGWGAYLAWDNFKDQDTLGETVLGGSQLLLEEMRDPKTKLSLLDSCDKPQRFADKIAILEAKMELLKEGKEVMIEAENAPPDLYEESRKAGEKNQAKWLEELRNLPKINGDPSDAEVERTAKEYEEYRKLPGLGGTPSIADREAMEEEYRNAPGLGETPSIAEHEAMVEEFRRAKEGDILFVPELPAEEWTGGNILDVPEIDKDNEQGLPLPELAEGDIPPLEINGESEVPLPELGDRSEIDIINGYEEELAAELTKLKTTCDDYVKKEVPAVVSKRCEDACKKYSQCAGFTEGATAADQQDAYDGCMEECAKWADNTKICINAKPIKTAIDCMNLSVCAMKEYGGG